MSSAEPDQKTQETEKEPTVPKDTNINNILAHLKKLETTNAQLSEDLQKATHRNEKLSSKTREGMQSALNTLMTKWLDAVDTGNEDVKNEFRGGLEKLVKHSAEENGVWQMMVAASALHERQEHNLEKMRTENSEMKQRLDGTYATTESRTDTRKRTAESQLTRADTRDNDTAVGGEDMWKEFGLSIGNLY